VQNGFEPKFSSARTKTEAIVRNVLARYRSTMDELDSASAQTVSHFHLFILFICLKLQDS